VYNSIIFKSRFGGNIKKKQKNGSIQMLFLRQADFAQGFGKEVCLPWLRRQGVLQAEKGDSQNQGCLNMADRYYEIGLAPDSLGITHSIYIKITRNQGIEVIHKERMDVNNPTNPRHEANLTKLSEYKGFRRITKGEFYVVKKLEHKVRVSGGRGN
jgi:hypothetical protein